MGKHILLGRLSVEAEMSAALFLHSQAEIEKGNGVLMVGVFYLKLNVFVDIVHGGENAICFFSTSCEDDHVINVSFVETYLEVADDLALDSFHVHHR